MNDIVNHPAHYAEGRKFEPIVVIENWELGFHLGNAVKYISRAGRKDPEKKVEDLEKAVWYIERHTYHGPDHKAFVSLSDVMDVCDDWELSLPLRTALQDIACGREKSHSIAVMMIKREIELEKKRKDYMRTTEIDGETYDIGSCEDCPFYAAQCEDSDCNHPKSPDRYDWSHNWDKGKFGPNCPLRVKEGSE